MTVWLVLVPMTAVAVCFVLYPFRRRAGGLRSGCDVAVYRDQLDEIERDRALGLIGDLEVAAARVEISRRLIAAADRVAAESEGGSPDQPVAQARHRRRTGAVASVAVSLGALALYAALGSPDLPGKPLALRTTDAQSDQSIDALVVTVESHLQKFPSDKRGWEVIAPVYMRLGRYDDAVTAWRNALELNGESAEREGYLGEALVAAGNGVVTADAKNAFERASALGPNDVTARFYLGLAAEQDGRRDEAAAAWRSLLSTAAPDAPWGASVRRALARVESPPSPNAPEPPSAKDMRAAASAAPVEQSEMIRGMVQRLADRLGQNGSDVEGWLRLVRSYSVLGEADHAQAALSDARRGLANDPQRLRQFEDGVAELGSPAARVATAPGTTASSPIASGPSPADVQAVSKLPTDQQNTMIQGMVGRLADRLKRDGSDVQGWLQLVRSYVVLGDREKARTAVSDAKLALSNESAKLRQLDDGVKTLGLQD
jgi:cytochrome c-type biogenesis protein CcmH